MHNLDFFIFKIVLTDVRLPFDVGLKLLCCLSLTPLFWPIRIAMHGHPGKNTATQMELLRGEAAEEAITSQAKTFLAERPTSYRPCR